MARRHIEALHAGQAIEKGECIPSQFKSVTEIGRYEFDESNGGVYSLQYSLDGKHLAVGFGNGGIVLLNSKTGKKEKEIRKGRYSGLQIMCMRFHPKEQHILLAGTAEGKLFLFDTEENQLIKELDEKGNQINALDFDCDGFQFATGGKDLSIRIYDSKTYQLIRENTGYSNAKPPNDLESGVSQRIFALKYHPATDYIFLTGGWENCVKIWDSRSSQGAKRTIPGPHICGDSLDIKDHEVLTGSYVGGPKALQTWGYTELNLKRNIKFPADKDGPQLYCAQFGDNDIVLAGGSGTNSIKAINKETDECIGEIKMKRTVYAMDSTFGGRLFAVGGAENYIKLASMS